MCPCGGAGQATRGFRKFLYQVTLVRIDPMEIDGTYLIHVNSIIHLWMFMDVFHGGPQGRHPEFRTKAC